MVAERASLRYSVLYNRGAVLMKMRFDPCFVCLAVWTLPPYSGIDCPLGTRTRDGTSHDKMNIVHTLSHWGAYQGRRLVHQFCSMICGTALFCWFWGKVSFSVIPDSGHNADGYPSGCSFVLMGLTRDTSQWQMLTQRGHNYCCQADFLPFH